METIWHILLTVCLSGNCVEQDVQWFDNEDKCLTMLKEYVDIPPDGGWDTVTYVCKPKGSMGA